MTVGYRRRSLMILLKKETKKVAFGAKKTRERERERERERRKRTDGGLDQEK
jgi:hypothetical protein